MTSNESFQVGRALGSLEATLRSNHAQSTDQTARLQRSLDHLIVTMQQAAEQTALQQSRLPKHTIPSDSPPSSLASVLQLVSKRVVMDLAVMAAKKIATSALPYLIPWGIFLAGLTWLGKASLRFLGFS